MWLTRVSINNPVFAAMVMLALLTEQTLPMHLRHSSTSRMTSSMSFRSQ